MQTNQQDNNNVVAPQTQHTKTNKNMQCCTKMQRRHENEKKKTVRKRKTKTKTKTKGKDKQ